MNTALRDAFKVKPLLVIEAKKYRSNQIGERIRTLKNMAYATFVADVPNGFPKMWDAYKASKAPIRKMGVNGGYRYKEAVKSLQNAHSGIEAYKYALKTITK